jgi:hypothetical protein
MVVISGELKMNTFGLYEEPELTENDIRDEEWSDNLTEVDFEGLGE